MHAHSVFNISSLLHEKQQIKVTKTLAFRYLQQNKRIREGVHNSGVPIHPQFESASFHIGFQISTHATTNGPVGSDVGDDVTASGLEGI